MLTDDNMRDYRGEDYEKVLVRVFLALSNLMNGGSDAQAYSLQVTDKQQQIINAGLDKNGENPKLAYKQVASGPICAAHCARRPTRTTTTCSGPRPWSLVGSPISHMASKTSSGPARPPFGAGQWRAVRLRPDRLGAAIRKRPSNSPAPWRC